MDLKKALSAAIAILVFAIMALAVADTAPWKEDGAQTGDDMDALVEALFTEHVIALEVLGILLTAALIGALTIARPIGDVAADDFQDSSDERSESETVAEGAVGAEAAAMAVPAAAQADVGGEEE